MLLSIEQIIEECWMIIISKTGILKLVNSISFPWIKSMSQGSCDTYGFENGFLKRGTEGWITWR